MWYGKTEDYGPEHTCQCSCKCTQDKNGNFRYEVTRRKVLDEENETFRTKAKKSFRQT